LSTGTEQYYERRALEYDRVYTKAERQEDLARLRESVPRTLAGRAVVEIAAGTGYWTDTYAEHAARVVATDVNAAVLDVALARRTWPMTVDFRVADAFALDEIDGSFDAAFVGFLWSHLRLDALDQFLDGLVRLLEPGAVMLFVDNRMVAGSNHPISRRDRDGNTFQERTLSDGSTWEVLKNFPSPIEVRQQLERVAADVEVASLEYFWTASCRTPNGRS
jgi:ubiquinone/menaquinone biosynthesis C-methylase UbiE